MGKGIQVLLIENLNRCAERARVQCNLYGEPLVLKGQLKRERASYLEQSYWNSTLLCDPTMYLPYWLACWYSKIRALVDGQCTKLGIYWTSHFSVKLSNGCFSTHLHTIYSNFAWKCEVLKGATLMTFYL